MKLPVIDLQGLRTWGKCPQGRKQEGLWKPREEPSVVGEDVREGFLEVVLSRASKVK